MADTGEEAAGAGEIAGDEEVASTGEAASASADGGGGGGVVIALLDSTARSCIGVGVN